MKKRFSLHLMTAGAVIVLSAISTFPAWASQISGHLDMASASSITGWAWDKENPDTPLSIELTISSESMGPGGYTVVTAVADQTRPDLKKALGSADHGFSCPVDWSQYQGNTFTVTASAVKDDEKYPLIGSCTYTYTKPTETVTETVPVVKEETNTANADSNMALGPGFAGNAGLTAGTSKTEKGKQTGPTAPTRTIETGEADEYLGEFQISGYCNCSSCSGGYTKTYSGTVPQADHTISADLNRFPIGTKLLINDIVYTVEDKGSEVVDNRLDIYFATHQEALDFGLRTLDVYSVK